MADGITIKSAGGQSASPQPTGDNGDDGSVIDLRFLDKKKSATGSTGATSNAGGVTPPVDASSSSVGATPLKKPKPGTILLGAEDDQTTDMAQLSKYTVPPLVKEKFPELIKLIKETESMNEEERSYWFQILPIMTEEQIGKFQDILVNEKEQLARLDSEYEKELQKLNEKHLIEWKEFEAREKRKALTTAESASEVEEKAKEEELLKRLSQV